MEAGLLHSDSGRLFSFGGGQYGQLGCGGLKVSVWVACGGVEVSV